MEANLYHDIVANGKKLLFVCYINFDSLQLKAVIG